MGVSLLKNNYFTKNFFYIYVLVLFSFSLEGYSLIFTHSDLKKCNLKFSKNFEWKEKYFSTDTSIVKALESHSLIHAETRVKQLECLQELYKKKNLTIEFDVELFKQRNLELELLEYSENYFYTLEKKYLFQKEESTVLKQFLKNKQEIYTSIYNETLKALDIKPELWIFQKLYFSQLWNTYEFLKSLRKEVRKKVLEEISN